MLLLVLARQYDQVHYVCLHSSRVVLSSGELARRLALEVYFGTSQKRVRV